MDVRFRHCNGFLNNIMVSCFGLAHLTFPLVIAFTYLFFQIELVTNSTYLLTELLVFLVLFILYGVSCFLLLQMKPGYENLRNKSNQMGIQNLFEFQGNQQRRKTIIAQLRKGDLAPSYIRGLQAQLTNLFTRSSFCEVCKFIKTPRTHHCRHCDKCILRMEYHCWLMNTCIGEANHRNYIQFLIFATLLAIYIGMSCSVNAIKYKTVFDSWSDLRQDMYVTLCAVTLALGVVATYMMVRTLKYARRNITAVEAKIQSFKKNNPYAGEVYLGKMFNGPCDWISLNYRTDDFQMELVEESPFTDH